MKVPMVVDKGRSARMEVEVGGGGGTVYTGSFHTNVTQCPHMIHSTCFF